MTHLIFRRASSAARTAGAATALLLAAPACSVFDTNVTNPNAIEEAALGDAASAPTLANGLNSAVTRMITSVYGPYSVASDELTWVGSRENWGLLDNGDVSDPLNEYNDAAYPFASEARWLSNYTIDRLEGFDKTGSLRNRADLARTYVYAAVAYITIGDNYDDFVLGADRTKPAAPVGEANMVQMYDSAIVYLDRSLVIAKALANTDLQSQILGLRARAKFSVGAVAMLLDPRARRRPIHCQRRRRERRRHRGARRHDERLSLPRDPTTANTRNEQRRVGNEFAQEIRAGGEYINPDPARSNLQPLLGVAGIKLKDPVTGQADPVMNKAIDECCRVAATTLIPFTLASWKEMQLILAEASLVDRQHDGFPNEDQRRARARCASGVGRNNAGGAGHCSFMSVASISSCKRGGFTTCIALG